MSDVDLHEAARLISEGWQRPDAPISEDQVESLAAFLGSLNRWNRVHSLTAVEGLQEQVSRHIMDALAAWAQLEARLGKNPALHIADVGAGMGIPGIAWAIVMPQSRFDLIERQQKKVAFLRHVVGRLGLGDRVRISASDVRQLRPEQPFDLIVSRAFAALSEFVGLTWHLSGPSTRWAAMMGKPPKTVDLKHSEHTLLDKVILDRVDALNVPGLSAQRHIAWLRRAS